MEYTTKYLKRLRTNILIILIFYNHIFGGSIMSNQTLDEVCDILDYINGNNSVPRNIREAAGESKVLLKDEEQDQSVRISTVLGRLDEISNDPNIPVHARTLIWEVLSKLESI